MYVLHASCSLSYPIGRGLEAEIELHCWGLLSTVLSAFSSPEIFPLFRISAAAALWPEKSQIKIRYAAAAARFSTWERDSWVLVLVFSVFRVCAFLMIPS